MPHRHWQAGTAVKDAVITIPAFFKETERMAMHNAASIAGEACTSSSPENLDRAWPGCSWSGHHSRAISAGTTPNACAASDSSDGMPSEMHRPSNRSFPTLWMRSPCGG
eukprot:scaffold303089_cov32-Tisochrysis_lutea.AAC.4